MQNMEQPQQTEETELPKTRIATAFIGLNYLSFAGLVVAFGLGFWADFNEGSEVTIHLSTGLISALLGMLGMVTAMFYLITTGAAIKEAVIVNKLDHELVRKTAQLKKTTFPWCMGIITLMIVTTFMGGLVQVGSLNKLVHAAIAGLTVILYFFTLKQVKKDFHANRVIMAEALAAIDKAEEEGSANAPDSADPA